MSIKVKRNTGIVGGMISVSLIVNNKKTTKMREKEEYIVDGTNMPTKIKAKQMYFGSKETEVEDHSTIEIITNPAAIVLSFASIGLTFVGSMLNIFGFVMIGFVACITTLFYSIKNWFLIKVKKA
jgi:hypothetical protein